jgi:hypothetical protein
MSTTLTIFDDLNNAECEKGQLSNRLSILYVPEVDIIMPKEEPQTLKVKLPDNSHLNMPIYSRGNTKEYLAHIVAVLQIIDQKGLPKKCGMLTKAVVRQSEALKNLLEAAGSQDTVSVNVDVQPASGDQADSTDAPRSPEGSRQGNYQDIRSTEEPPVR